MTKSTCFGLVALLALTLVAGPARADSQADVAAQLAKARELSSRGDQRNACRAFQHASELAQGKSAASLLGLSSCYSDVKDADKAIATARQALAAATTPEERTEATTALAYDLLRQPGEQERTEALGLFKQEVAASDGTKGQDGLLSALLMLHRDQEAAEIFQDLKKQGKSGEGFLSVSYRGSQEDAAQIDDFNDRLHRLAPDAPLRVEGKVTRPEIKHQVKPEAPEEIWHHPGFDGTVILEAIIDSAGKVTNVRILKGQPFGLSEKAGDAVKQWTFKPATFEGQPVKVYYVLTVNYKVGPSHPSPWPTPLKAARKSSSSS
jgi:TonB family protein